MDNLFEHYMQRASEIIGERTSEEIAYDKAVIRELEKGRTIKKALKIAGNKYANEALKCTKENIDDIAAYYEYLMKHEDMLKKISRLSRENDKQDKL